MLAYIAPGWTALDYSDTTWGHGLLYGFRKFTGDDDSFDYTYVQASGVVEFGDETIVDVSSTPWIAMPILAMLAMAVMIAQFCMACSPAAVGATRFTAVLIILCQVSIMIAYVFTDFWVEMSDRCDDPLTYTCDESAIKWTFSRSVSGIGYTTVVYKFWWSYFFGCVVILFSLISLCLAQAATSRE